MAGKTKVKQEGVIYDAKDLIESLFWIENKQTEVVPFIFNNVQKTYYKARTNRDIILKARQEGFSSMILAIWLTECMQKENTTAVVISQEKAATQRLLKRVKDYLRYLERRTGLKVKLEYESRDLLSFPETHSTFYIGTAGAKAFGRGDTINLLHCSEVAWWEEPKDLMAGLTQAVPRDGHIVMETTANGYGDYLHRTWQKARDRDSAYMGHFFGWNLCEEYKEKAPRGKFVLTEFERQLRKQYKLTYNQLLWRRNKVKEFDTLEDFQREYPINDAEAFIAPGMGIFDAASLKEMFANAPNPIRIGSIEVG